MDAIDSHPTAKEQQPSSPSPSTTDPLILRLSNQPGMGLPYESWDHIISFLKLEPYPLLACCLTCKSFFGHANNRLRYLSSPIISLHDYTDIDNLVKDVRTFPGRAQTIRELSLIGQPALAFSLVPHRLAMQLVNLRGLTIHSIAEAPFVHCFTWSLYGHAFPSVTFLRLVNTQFPSFKDFVRFVASFRVLKHLLFDKISFASPKAPLKFPPLPSAEYVRLNKVQFPSFEDFLRFVALFRALESLYVEDISFAHPGGLLEFLQSFTTTRVKLYNIQFPSFEDFFHFVASFPALETLAFMSVSFALPGALSKVPKFPSTIEKVLIDHVQFPSFEDFIHFVTSFSALQQLDLLHISCAHPGVSPSTSQSRTLNPVEHLNLHLEDEGPFLELLAHWLSFGGCVIREIGITPRLGLHPSGYLLLQGIHTHLSKFTLLLGHSIEGDSRKPSQKFLDVFLYGFPNLRKLTVLNLSNVGVGCTRALIAHAVRPNLTLEIHPILQEDDSRGAWDLLDAILFGLRVRHKLQVHVEDVERMEVHFPLMSSFG